MPSTRARRSRTARRRLLLLSGAAVVTAVTSAVVVHGELAPPAPDRVPLSRAVEAVEDGDVTTAVLDEAAAEVVLTLADGRTLASGFPGAYADELTADLVEAGVEVETDPVRPPGLLDSLLPLVVMVLLVGGLVWGVRSGGLSGVRLKGTRGEQVDGVPSARFSDVAGCEEAVTEMKELVEFLKDGERFTRVGAKPPRGALLVGPPGTGKTLLARAVAGEAGVPFFPLAGSDFVETFAGVGARRVRDLFDRARESEGGIIFIDEIDAIGRARSEGPGHSGADTERENTLISMLNEMDGFDTDHRIIVLAATNRADVLDPALTRPGRLDRQVQVPAPDRRGRTQILEVHAASRPMADDVDLVSVARRTPGMSGAELAQVVNEACMEAARRGLVQVGADCLDAAVATVALGRARTSALVTEHDRRITAWHEAGHALTALLLEDADDPVQVSIVPRGPAGGVTWMSGNDDSFLTRRRALADLRVAMGGRAAEELLLDGEFTQGAHGDLDSASRRALAMVTKYGMSRHGYLLVDDDTVRMGGQVATEVREVAEELLAAAHEDAFTLLATHRVLLDAVAGALLEAENLTLADLLSVQASVDAAAPPVAAAGPGPRVPAQVPTHVTARVPAQVRSTPALPEVVGAFPTVTQKDR
ncbi:ATP-dependent metallopeptidase FtsH/Yme1/Tma family protein [Aquipuribacter hungaricus]|uniref:ATP-dependent metallopeptidase FtsH/Yme1/Tma family protein n=1 Tax=Aquipuribacter hungaricus TaxID=545624 RepID=A0ABV7WJH1_9MICO